MALPGSACSPWSPGMVTWAGTWDPKSREKGSSSPCHPRKILLGKAESWWTLCTPPASSSGHPQNPARHRQGVPMPCEARAAGQARDGGFGPCLAAWLRATALCHCLSSAGFLAMSNHHRDVTLLQRNLSGNRCVWEGSNVPSRPKLRERVKKGSPPQRAEPVPRRWQAWWGGSHQWSPLGSPVPPDLTHGAVGCSLRVTRGFYFPYQHCHLISNWEMKSCPLIRSP